MSRVNNEYRDIVLGGVLGQRFGKNHRLVVANPVEALRMLALRDPEFKPAMQALVDAGTDFHIMDGDIERTIGDITFPATGTIVITPVPEGEKSGIFSVLAGVVLLVAAFYTDGATYPEAQALLIGAGASLVLGGITALLTTIPRSNDGSGDDLTSAFFSGSTNTQQQGVVVPVIYGRMLVGAQAVYARMTTTDLANAPIEVGNLT
jgi:predicted phage tail protein